MSIIFVSIKIRMFILMYQQDDCTGLMVVTAMVWYLHAGRTSIRVFIKMSKNIPDNMSQDRNDTIADEVLDKPADSTLWSVLSVYVAYTTGQSFGFHLTSLEIVKKLYCVQNRVYTLDQFYLMTSILFICPILGSMVYSHVGLRFTLWIGLVMLTHSIACAGMVVPNYLSLVVCRCVAGIAIGISTAVAPQYISRIKPANRGFYIFLFQVSVLGGVLLGQVCTYFTSTVFAFCVTFLLFSLFSLANALLSFFMLQPANYMHIAINQRSVYDLLSKRRHMRSVVIAVLVHMGQQMSGIKGIIVYLNTLLSQQSDNAELGSIFVGIFSFTITLTSSFVVDVCGRKVLLLLSSVIISTALVLLILQRCVLAAIFLFYFGYSAGFGPITWLLTNELFPLRYQKAANAVCVAVNWLCSFLVVAFFEFLYTKVGCCILWLFVCCMLFCMVTFILFYNETKGKNPDFQ